LFVDFLCRTYGAQLVAVVFMILPSRWGFDYPDFKTVNLDGKNDAFILSFKTQK